MNIQKFAKNDEVKATIDTASSKIVHMDNLSAAKYAPTITTQKYHGTFYFYDFKLITTKGPFIGHLRVQKDPGGGNKVYDVNITKSSIIMIGLGNLRGGESLYIEYDDRGNLIYVDRHPRSEDAKIVPKEDNPKDWTNLCQQSMMFICGAKAVKQRKECHFWSRSTSRVDDCCHFRESMAAACDCVAAQIHLQKYGAYKPVTKQEKKEPEESWDELLMKRIGRKV